MDIFRNINTGAFMKNKIISIGLTVIAGFGLALSQGFTISGTSLKDANGNTFIQKGFAIPLAWFVSDVNGNIANMKKNSNGNCFRIVMTEGMADNDWHTCVSSCIANKVIPEVELHDVTCGTDASGLNTAAKWWVSKASYLTQASIAKYILINIANEWGDWNMAKTNPAAWASAYQTAVATMRSGGINTTLIIDAPDCGQDLNNGSTLIKYAMTVFNSDPKKNCLFTVHLYGEWCPGGGSTPSVGLPAIKNAGIPFIVGEFADQSSAGNLDEKSVMSTCETNKIGWMAWSWKGNNEPVIDMCNDWAGTSLTTWGQTAINGAYGTKTATTCSVFTGNTDTKTPENASITGPDVHVSLNPLLKGVVNVELHGLTGVTVIKIIDINGKLVQEQTSVNGQKFQLNTHADSGVFIVKVINAQKIFARKIFVR